jgi:hypothetical protein
MPAPTRLLTLCVRCEHRQRTCDGPCPCTLDGRDILDHARERYCPAGRYQLGLGDTIAGVLHKTGIGPAYLKLRSKVTKKPCNCPKNIKRLNTAFPSKSNATAP